MSKKMISLQKDANQYLTAHDIDAVDEDIKRENTASNVSGHHRRDTGNPSDTRVARSNLGLIGEEDNETEFRDSQQ